MRYNYKLVYELFLMLFIICFPSIPNPFTNNNKKYITQLNLLKPMPPKKKQEEIDLSTLPQSVSVNGLLLCLGKKDRSQKILTKIFTDNKQFISKITRHQVLEHAKQKNIYIDPTTLTDKQKKDAKFMQTVCTQLTGEVFAKATKSLIDHLSVKIRLQLKAQNEKPQDQRPEFLAEKKLDQLFILSEGFCQSCQQYEALSAINQGLKYIMVLNPIISWANAPEIQQNGQEDEQQQDEEIKQFKALKQRQELTQDDIAHIGHINEIIEKIKDFRRQSSLSSSFRDCIIEMVNCEIDPYNEQQSINDSSKTFNQRLGKLYVEYDEFVEWKKDKVKIQILGKEENQQQKQQNNQVEKNDVRTKGTATIQILNSFIDSLFSSGQQKQQQDEDIESLINEFDFSQSNTNHTAIEQTIPTRKDKKLQFYKENDESILSPIDLRILQEQTHNRLQYPGINRYLMPDIPLKSQPLRKLQRSHYAQFLSEDLPFEQLQRRLSLMRFQQIVKQIDEDRKYSFKDRVFEQHHDEKSLMRQLYRSMMIYDDAHFLTRYSQQDDKLYLVLLYKNNQRRLHTKQWQSVWKVLPNYESWLKYFKQNEQNMNVHQFYDLDYQKIGNINQKIRAFSVPDSGVIVKKQSLIGGKVHKFLYGIKNHHLFGLKEDNLKRGMFYSENKKTKVNHFCVKRQQKQNQEGNDKDEYESQIIVDQSMTIRLKPQTGDVIVQIKGENRRMYTPNGYTVIYENQSSRDYKILHPTGGISTPTGYINERGLGMKDNIIHSVPTLLRKQQEQGFKIIKRDDNTVTVIDQQKKWIRFQDGTEYLVTPQQTKIQKSRFPFVKCTSNQIEVQINDIKIKGVPLSDQRNPSYLFTITFNDGNSIVINNAQVCVNESLSQTPYIVDLHNKCMKVEFGPEVLEVSYNQQKYMKNGRIFDPTQNEQNYAEDQTLPQDYVEPKLFIISPEGHGVEYLSQKQLSYYFSTKQDKNDKKNHLISEIQNDKLTSNLHVISKIIGQNQINPKRIVLDKNINLDIFKSLRHFIPKVLVQKFTVRSLIKHKNLLPQDQTLINDIKQKKQEWIKKMRKEENQFGNKPKGDKTINQVNKHKLLTIEFRKKQLTQVDIDQLKQQAIGEWKSKEKEHLTMIAQQEQEEKIRMKLRQRKKSYVQEYPPLVINPKQQLQEQQNFTNSPFYTHYFQTLQGKKALSQMPDQIFRPKSAKVKLELDPQIVTQLHKTMNQTKKHQSQEENQQKERYDTVDVNLKPVRQIYIKPSVFTQRQIDEQREAFEQQKKAYFYHEKKRKDFNLYGEQRRQKVQVKSMLRTQPISQINQKYLITEAPLDKRIKISSMKNKLTSQASTLIEMRKQGPHQTLLKTLDKRNDYNTLLEKRTMMVHADLNDKLQRDILITPVQAEFGYLKEGRSYEMRINVKNEDILAQRLVVKKARNINVKVMMSEMGPIALGMSRKIIVQIQALPQFMGRFNDEFEIISKHQIYKIPVTAHILSQSQFENDGIKLAPNVKQIQEVLKRKTSGLPPIK